MEDGFAIRSISRSIAVLQAINRHGSLSMMAIAEHGGVPYPTAVRIVQTLITEGLIEREPSRKWYRATALVHSLSSGYQSHNALVDVSRPHLSDITQQIGSDSYILSAKNVSVTNFYGIANFRGKENPFISKYTANVSLSYTHPLNDHADGFGRVDFTYKSGGYTDISNTSWGPDQTQVNVRLGVKTKALTVEGYVTNLVNDRAYYNVGTSGLNAYGVV